MGGLFRSCTLSNVSFSLLFLANFIVASLWLLHICYQPMSIFLVHTSLSSRLAHSTSFLTSRHICFINFSNLKYPKYEIKPSLHLYSKSVYLSRWNYNLPSWSHQKNLEVIIYFSFLLSLHIKYISKSCWLFL